MNEKININKPLLVIFSLLSTSIFYAYQYFYNWPLLKLSGILGSSRYVDLVAIQDISKCVAKYGIRVYEISDTCSGYQYSMGILYIFEYTGISTLNRNIAAVIFEVPIILFMLMLIAFAFKHNKSAGFYSLITMLSPGIWFLLERGNLDSIMVICIAVSALTFGKRGEILGFLALLISVLTKFYSAPLLIIYVLFGKKKYRNGFYLPITILLAVISLIQISHVAKFPSTWYVSFGAGSVGHWANLFLEYQLKSNFRIPEKTGLIAGTLIACASMAIHWKFFRRSQITPGNFLSTKSNLILFLGVTFIACYFAGMSYDYRMIFPIIVSILVLLEEESLPFKPYFLLISTGSFYLSSFFYGQSGMSVIYQQLIGDIFVGLLVSYISVYLIHKYFDYFKEIVGECKKLIFR